MANQNNQTIKSTVFTQEVVCGDHVIKFEVGHLAGQANGAVLAQAGGTVVIATVVAGQKRDDLDYFPLQVEYQERMYAGGKIKGSRWVKREGRPTDEAILSARLIDRSIRPLFPKEFKNETQVLVTVLSVDGENDPAILGINAVSAALSVSDIPWNGPIAGSRTGFNGQLTASLSWLESASSRLNLIVSSSQEAIVMVEAGAKEITEEETIKALEFADNNNKKIISAILSLTAKAGKTKQKVVKEPGLTKKIKEAVAKEIQTTVDEIVKKSVQSKGKPDTSLLSTLTDELSQQNPDFKKALFKELVEEVFKSTVRKELLKTKMRIDGRKTDEIRPLSAEVGILPRTHGSAIFQRGNTQALSIVTLGSPNLEQLIESMEREETKRYIHHYNMPPYSVGETGRMGWPSRREVGHGALAERALEPVIPDEDKFPYTIRVVSEIMSSNGSTSMASVCGSTLSLMDAGVPIKKPVAGIAMGLIVDNPDGGIKKDNYLVLTDIQGVEDHIGDMDFKVAGTKEGITALQMDIKVSGVTAEVLAQALAQAKKARMTILQVMNKAIASPRDKVSIYAPKVRVINVDKEKIGEIIGPGGRMIRQITAETGAELNIDDDGKVTISSPSAGSLKKAVDWVQGMVREVEVGEVFENAEVKRILPFGAFVEILPGKEGMVHVSKMSTEFVSKPEDVVAIGDKVKVWVEEIDKLGRINLTMVLGKGGNKSGNDRKGGSGDRHRNWSNHNSSPRGGRSFNQKSNKSSFQSKNRHQQFAKSKPLMPKPLADWQEN